MSGVVGLTVPHERKLEAYARRLRMVGITTGSIPLGPYRFEIEVDEVGYTVVSQTEDGRELLTADEP